MSWQSDIFDALQASEELTDMIGDRVSWDIADGSTATPYLVLQAISGTADTDYQGGREITNTLVQVTCWSPSKAEVIAVTSALRDVLEIPELPGDSLTSCIYAGENSTYDSDTRFYGEITDYRAIHNTN